MCVRIWLGRSDDIGGKLIRFFTWSDWNHVGIEINGCIYDSTSSRGVGMQSVKQFKKSWDEVQCIDIELKNVASAEDFLKEQVGAKYDWFAILGFVFRRGWAKKNKWFCSELVIKAMQEGGMNVRLKKNRITPRELILITSAMRFRTKDENNNSDKTS